MSRVTYSHELKQAAFEQYTAGRSFESIRDSLGPSLRTLARWSEEQDWPGEAGNIAMARVYVDNWECAP